MRVRTARLLKRGQRVVVTRSQLVFGNQQTRGQVGTVIQPAGYPPNDRVLIRLPEVREPSIGVTWSDWYHPSEIQRRSR